MWQRIVDGLHGIRATVKLVGESYVDSGNVLRSLAGWGQ